MEEGPGSADTLEEGERLAKVIGDKHVVFMKNHGVLVTGDSVAQAYRRLYKLERVCRAPDGKMTARLHVLWDSRIFTTHLKNILSWNGHAHVKRDGEWERLKQRG